VIIGIQAWKMWVKMPPIRGTEHEDEQRGHLGECCPAEEARMGQDPAVFGGLFGEPRKIIGVRLVRLKPILDPLDSSSA
jgi:hypothetical protein